MLPSVEADAATKTYTISTNSKALSKYIKLVTYNKYTKDYYVFRGVFDDCAKNSGGTMQVILSKWMHQIFYLGNKKGDFANRPTTHEIPKLKCFIRTYYFGLYLS